MNHSLPPVWSPLLYPFPSWEALIWRHFNTVTLKAQYLPLQLLSPSSPVPPSWGRRLVSPFYILFHHGRHRYGGRFTTAIWKAQYLLLPLLASSLPPPPFSRVESWFPPPTSFLPREAPMGRRFTTVPGKAHHLYNISSHPDRGFNHCITQRKVPSIPLSLPFFLFKLNKYMSVEEYISNGVFNFLSKI